MAQWIARQVPVLKVVGSSPIGVALFQIILFICFQLLTAFRLFLSQVDMTALWQYYSGDYNAFVDALATIKLSLRQAAVVSRCWSKITGSG